MERLACTLAGPPQDDGRDVVKGHGRAEDGHDGVPLLYRYLLPPNVQGFPVLDVCNRLRLFGIEHQVLLLQFIFEHGQCFLQPSPIVAPQVGVVEVASSPLWARRQFGVFPSSGYVLELGKDFVECLPYRRTEYHRAVRRSLADTVGLRHVDELSADRQCEMVRSYELQPEECFSG